MTMDPAEYMMEPKDFIDPGADDDERVKGIKQGHIREWHDAFFEMEERYHAEHRTVARVWKELGVSTFEEAGGLAIFEIVANQRAALQKVHHTLTVHGHIDADTDLHATIQTALDPTASARDLKPAQECHSSQADPGVTAGAEGESPLISRY